MSEVLHPSDELEAMFSELNEEGQIRLAFKLVGWIKGASRHELPMQKELSQFLSEQKVPVNLPVWDWQHRIAAGPRTDLPPKCAERCSLKRDHVGPCVQLTRRDK